MVKQHRRLHWIQIVIHKLLVGYLVCDYYHYSCYCYCLNTLYIGWLFCKSHIYFTLLYLLIFTLLYLLTAAAAAATTTTTVAAVTAGSSDNQRRLDLSDWIMHPVLFT